MVSGINDSNKYFSNIGIDPSSINASNYKSLVKLNTIYDSPSLNEVVDTYEEMSGKEDVTAKFLNSKLNKFNAAGEAYGQYEDDDSMVSSVLGANSLFSLGKDKLGLTGGFIYESSMMSAKTIPVSSNDLLPSITDDDEELDIYDITSSNLSDNAVVKRSYGAFLMGKYDLDNYTVGGGVSTNVSGKTSEETTGLTTYTAGILDKPRHVALTWKKNVYTTDIAGEKTTTSKDNVKVTFLPLTDNNDDAEKEISSGTLSEGSSYSLPEQEYGLHIDLNLQGDDDSKEYGVTFSNPIPLHQKLKLSDNNRFVLNPVAGAYQVHTDEDEPKSYRLTTGVVANYTTASNNGFYLDAKFQTVNDYITDFNDEKKNVFYTSLNAKLNKDMLNGNKFDVSLNAGNIKTKEIDLSYIQGGIGYTSGNLTFKGEAGYSKLNMGNAVSKDFIAGFRATYNF